MNICVTATDVLKASRLAWNLKLHSPNLFTAETGYIPGGINPCIMKKTENLRSKEMELMNVIQQNMLNIAPKSVVLGGNGSLGLT